MGASAALAEALRQAVLAQRFADTADAWAGGAPLGVHPSIDLAVLRFDAAGGATWANLLFSREHPQGLVAQIGDDAGAVQNVRFDRDQRNAQGDSLPWLPGADWSRIGWQPLHGNGAHRFVVPYPASLLKLMVAVGVAAAVDEGLSDWPAALEPMLVLSDNDATNDCVALLHRVGRMHTLNASFAAHGLPTLQMHDTTAAGGWRNADGAGVGHIHMTAWDTLRLLWLLDAEALPAPWLPAGMPPLLQPATRDHLRGVLERQRWNHVLSSGSLRGTPDWVDGLPDAPAFAHKTGTTDNYASDAGILRDGSLHGIVAIITSLGRRFAPQPPCATTWRVPALGGAIHRLMRTWQA